MGGQEITHTLKKKNPKRNREMREWDPALDIHLLKHLWLSGVYTIINRCQKTIIFCLNHCPCGSIQPLLYHPNMALCK